MKRKRKLKKINVVRYSILLLGVLIILSLGLSFFFLSRKVPHDEIFVKIPKNIKISQIVEILNSKGILKPKIFFVPVIKIYCTIWNCTPVAGTYRFTAKNTNFDVLRSILFGKQLSVVKVTYPEGITLKDFAMITKRELGVDTADFFEAIRKGHYIERMNIPVNSLEGYLMPETYFFFYGTDAETVVNKLVETQTKIWNEKFDSIARAKGLSRHFVLTLASIIELESPLKSERKTISGVFYNRLARGMKLQSDPTVQYATNRKTITYEDLNVDNEYNTYKYSGLPPGPICSPSVSSIEAALEPEQHSYLYFVAYGDGSGRHRFAKTFQEHLLYKRIYKDGLKKQNASIK